MAVARHCGQLQWTRTTGVDQCTHELATRFYILLDPTSPMDLNGVTRRSYKEAVLKRSQWPTSYIWRHHTRVNVNTTDISNLKKGKGFPLQAWSDSWGSRRLRLLDLLDIRHYEGGKVVILTHRPPSPPRVFLVLIFRDWFHPRAHGSVGSLGKNPLWHHRWSIPRPSD
jgi:hypothetical protein